MVTSPSRTTIQRELLANQRLHGGQKLIPTTAPSEAPQASELQLEGITHDFFRGFRGESNVDSL